MAPAVSCANHPERVASARCPSCARPICNECTIKIEGINVCSDCLRARARREESKRRPKRSAGRVGAAAAVLAAFSGLTLVLFLYGLILASIL
ncbi:MAG TPA: B-box zinc finger protein [Planctomycetota bacterium]